MNRVSTGTVIHALPTSVSTYPSNGGSVTIKFGDGSSGYHDLTIFTGSAAMAIDLHAAIKVVIDNHAVVASDEEVAA